MVEVGPLSRRPDGPWTYALVGGLASVPLTVGLYWLSGTGSEFSLNMVFVGGLLAGYLATAWGDADPGSVGVRAGVVGGVPGLVWFLVEMSGAISALSGPLWFQIAASTLMLGALTAVVLGVSGGVGLLGAKVGGWLARKNVGRRPPVAGD